MKLVRRISLIAGVVVVVLIIGVLILWGGLRAFFRGSIIGGIIQTLLGLFILSWLMM